MKVVSVVVVVVLMVFIEGRSWGQNLVINPSFEELDTCLYNSGLINIASPWFKPTSGTTDIFNTNFCDNLSELSVPSNFVGYQMAHSGNSYAGFFTYERYPGYDSLIYREYLETRLSQTLISGVKYFVSFYLSPADSFGYVTDDVGASFTSDSLLSTNWSNLNVIPQIENTEGSFISDKQVWTLINGSFIALGNEQFLTIGNFKDDLNTDTLFIPPVGQSLEQKKSSYFYIDDICISSDSLTCLANPLEVETPASQPTFSVSPNPVQNLLTIDLLSPSGTIIAVYDVQGRKIVLPTTYSNNKAELTTTTLPNGIYLLQIINNKTGMSEVGKFVKE